MIIKLEGLVNVLIRIMRLNNSGLEVNGLISINNILYTGSYLFLGGTYIVTKLSILYWQDIPTVVEGKDKEGVQKVELSKRFSELVDMVAMRKGLIGTDEYLENWGKRRLPSSDKSAKQGVKDLVEDFEKRFDEIKTKALNSLL